MKRFLGRPSALFMGCLLLPLVWALDARAIQYHDGEGQIKVLNYSRYNLRIVAEPLESKLREMARFDTTVAPAPGKGAQTIALQNMRFAEGKSYVPERGGMVIRGSTMQFTLYADYAGSQKCYSLLVFSRRHYNMDVSYTWRLGTDQAAVGCPSANGPEISWKTSQDDIEVVVDPQRTSWNNTSIPNDPNGGGPPLGCNMIKKGCK